MKLRASAPGKLVLLGEYAVLEGAPALVVAVDRRAVVEVCPAEGDYNTIKAPEVWPTPEAFSLAHDGSPHWLNPHPQLPAAMSLVTEVIRRMALRGWLPKWPFDLALDSASFFENRNGDRSKLGLGSSAAVTVAMASALRASSGTMSVLEYRDAWLNELRGIHRGLQGGRGSGADIAAAVYGGISEFRVDADQARVKLLDWPEDLHRLWVWSGQPASTTDFLNMLDTWRQACPEHCRHHMRVLTEIAQRGTEALKRRDISCFLECISDVGAALQSFGLAGKIPIFSCEHRHIAGIVEDAGGVYKPCGAGGGDLGVALTGDTVANEHVRASLEAGGYAVLDLGIDNVGLTLTRLVD